MSQDEVSAKAFIPGMSSNIVGPGRFHPIEQWQAATACLIHPHTRAVNLNRPVAWLLVISFGVPCLHCGVGQACEGFWQENYERLASAPSLLVLSH